MRIQIATQQQPFMIMNDSYIGKFYLIEVKSLVIMFWRAHFL
jgi:hypothetical protein